MPATWTKAVVDALEQAGANLESAQRRLPWLAGSALGAAVLAGVDELARYAGLVRRFDIPAE